MSWCPTQRSSLPGDTTGWYSLRCPSLRLAAPSGRSSNLQVNVASSAVTFITWKRLVSLVCSYEDHSSLCVLYICRNTYFNGLYKSNESLLAINSKITFSFVCCLEHTPLSTPILFKGNNGCTGTVSTIFPGRQQTGLPKENSGQQSGRQASVQFVPENTEKAVASSMRSPLLFVLFQQNCEVSSVMVASELARCVACVSSQSLSPMLP